MYTSDTDTKKRGVLKHATGELLFAAFCALFGAIYESFSFGVFSFFMIYAFAFPFAAGIVQLAMYIWNKEPGQRFLNLFNSAAVTATLGSLSAGVVEIYGTENRLLIAYPVACAILIAASVFFLIRDSKKTQTA